MRIDDSPADRKPQTSAAHVVLFAAALELRKQPVRITRRQSGSRVIDADSHRVIVEFGRNADMSARWGVLNGVLEEVADNLRYERRVDMYRGQLGWQIHLDRAVAEGREGREDILAEELRLAARSLGRLTGRVDVDDILDVIFKDFCIGK